MIFFNKEGGLTLEAEQYHLCSQDRFSIEQVAYAFSLVGAISSIQRLLS
jgi:hypothetical protein